MHEALKNSIVSVCHKMWQKGWTAANDGNVSIRTEEGLILCTGTGISKGDVTPEDIGLIDNEMNIIESPSEEWRPSSEMKLHLMCYRERPDINAVVHAHPPYSTGFACAGVPLDCRCAIDAVLWLGDVPEAPYGAPSTNAVPEAVEPFIKDRNAVLMANHGALTLGKDLKTAWYRMEVLEHHAQVMLTARLLGGPRDLDEQELEQLHQLRKSYGLD